MLRDSPAYSGFSVDDVEKARDFYGGTLGLDVRDSPAGLELHLANGTAVFIYGKDDHVPATFTILNFPVDDIDAAVDELTGRGVVFDTSSDYEADDTGIFRGTDRGQGPNIAWFKDPAGNFLSVLEVG
jgi:catechol 2,3-dioxygenase-like lactoylglutathione lyase family enzyme